MAKKKPIKRRPDSQRRLRQASRHARTIRLLQMIVGRGRWNARDLARELEVTERTIYRDLDVLALAGVPWFFDEGQRCYRVRPDFRFPVVNLTPEELVGQATAAAITTAAGLNIGSGAKPVMQKLAQTAGESSAHLMQEVESLISVFDLKLADHSRSHDIIKTVQWALLTRKQLAGIYVSPYQEEPVKLTLTPYRLCLAQQAWYLIACPEESDGPRTFRMTRFKSLRMLDKTAEIPATFDLKAYFGNAWAVFRGAERHDVEILFSADAARLVTETTWHSTQSVKAHKDGTVSLHFQVDGLDEIVWWVLGWSGRAKVVQPEQLRHMVVQELTEALALNEK